MTKSKLPDEPTMSVPEAGRLFFGLGRDASYRAAAAGQIPMIRLGRLQRVPTAKVRKMVGLEKVEG